MLLTLAAAHKNISRDASFHNAWRRDWCNGARDVEVKGAAGHRQRRDSYCPATGARSSRRVRLDTPRTPRQIDSHNLASGSPAVDLGRWTGFVCCLQNTPVGKDTREAHEGVGQSTGKKRAKGAHGSAHFAGLVSFAEG